MQGIPLIARLDGRAFHTFTRGLTRPYDSRMSTCMQETTAHLVDSLHALVGYTQSDEISLAWFFEADSPSQYPFDGRFQKLASVLAGTASAKFCELVREHLPGKEAELPHFDCRVWQVPTLDDAAQVFVWREDDAVKNSLSMAAQAYYSHSELHGKGSSAKHELLHLKGVNWNDYPAFFKRGVYFQRKTYKRSLTEEERMRIAEKHRPAADALFERSCVIDIELPPIRKVTNIVDVLFRGAKGTTDAVAT